MRVAICILFLRKALASEASWVAKKIWLPIHPQNFGSHVTVRTPACTPVRPHHRETNVTCHTFLLVWEPST